MLLKKYKPYQIFIIKILTNIYGTYLIIMNIMEYINSKKLRKVNFENLAFLI